MTQAFPVWGCPGLGSTTQTFSGVGLFRARNRDPRICGLGLSRARIHDLSLSGVGCPGQGSTT